MGRVNYSVKSSYITWIKTNFPNDSLRLFFLLENFTKFMVQEPHLMSELTYFDYWISYVI